MRWWTQVTEGWAGRPLAGRRILITRTPYQASELVERLRGLGAETILIPTIQIVPPRSFAELDDALGCLGSFDVVAFTSANAVRAFAARVEELSLDARPGRIAVVGAATARAVEAAGLQVDVMPEVYTADGLAARLLPEVHGCKVLLVLAEGALPTLQNALTAGGAGVVVAKAYANRIPEGSLAAMKGLFESEWLRPHAVTFTSASTAVRLVALLQEAGLTLPESVARISIGPITSAALLKLGIPAHAEAVEATINGLLAALVRQLGASK